MNIEQAREVANNNREFANEIGYMHGNGPEIRLHLWNMAGTIDSLIAEVDTLKADAERYRWLRVQNADLDAGFYFGDETDALPEDITWVGSDLDAAVDLAMKGTS